MQASVLVMAFGKSAFALGTPATGKVALGPLPTRNAALALNFQSVVTSTDQYGASFPPDGGGYAVLSGTADPTPAVQSKFISPNSFYSDTITLSGLVYDLITSACTFCAPNTHNLVQQLAGGVLLTAGNNSRVPVSNLTKKNTVVIAIQSASPSMGSAVGINSITDNLGNVWKALTGITIFNPTFHQFHQLFVFSSVIRFGGASTITINIAGTPGTANSWIGEFHFT